MVNVIVRDSDPLVDQGQQLVGAVGNIDFLTITVLLMPVAFLSIPLLIALPVILLMAIWAVISLARVLYPEGLKRRSEVEQADLIDLKKTAFPVRSRDIVDDLHRQTAHTLEEEPHLVEDARQEFEPLFGDLWLRRN